MAWGGVMRLQEHRTWSTWSLLELGRYHSDSVLCPQIAACTPVPAARRGQACDGVMIRQAQRARLTVGCDDASRHSSSCHHGRQRPAVDTASGPAESFPWRMRKRQHRRWGRPQPLSRAQSTSGRVVSRRRETPPTTTALTADHHRSPHR